MKYCKVCKTAAKDADTLCPKGHALSVFGAEPRTSRPAPVGAETPGPSATMFTLMGEVQRLEETKKQILKRGRNFGLLSLVAAMAISVVLYQVYARTVLDYAILENIEVAQDPQRDWTIQVSYDVVHPGKVAFDRNSGTRHTQKLDVIANTGPGGFTWTWPSDPKTGIDFTVLSRGGWLRATSERHFKVTTIAD